MNPMPPAAPDEGRRLLRSTAIAAGLALVILVTAILPAEYGVDPTGIGRAIGLTQMGEIKMSLAREVAALDSAEAAAAAAPAAAATETVPAAADSVTAPAAERVTTIELEPGQGKEVKLVMRSGAQATYAWTAVGGVVNYDTHGDSTNAPNSYFNYKKGTGVQADEGLLTAAFDGKHGWFWRNRTNAVVKITLRTSGEYEDVVIPN
jgi:hypothetical protein